MRAKWPDDLLSEGFVPFPKRILRVLRLLFEGVEEIEEIAVLLAVIDYKRPNQMRQPTMATLAYNAGLPLGDFKDALSRLKHRGWVAIDFEPKNETVEIGVKGFCAAARELARAEET